MRLFKHGQPQPPDYRADRTVEAFIDFIHQRLDHDEQLAFMSAEEKKLQDEREELERDDHLSSP